MGSMRQKDSRSITSATRSVISSAAAACAFSLLVAAPVSAQTIQVSLQSFAGRRSADIADLAMASARPVSAAECAANADLAFRFSSVDSTRAELRFFHGTNCEMSSVRNDTTDTSCTELPLQIPINMNTQVDEVIPIGSLIDCTAGGTGSRQVYVLALDNDTSEVTGMGQQVNFPIAYDFDGPTAPQDLAARAGESQMTLDWTASTDQLDGYEVYFVANGCDDETRMVTTTRLTDENLTEGDLLRAVAGATSTTTAEFPDDAAIGSWHAVAIRAIDKAKNPGALSEPVCVQRISITTWFDTYCSGASPPAACTSSGCTVAPGRRGDATGLAFLAAFALFGLVWRERR